MIELTDTQCRELRETQGGEVRLSDPTTGHEYVILRAEVFERLRRLVYDDNEWTPEEQLRLLVESGKRAGWDHPQMDVYDDYEANRKKLCP